jgi:hypothetical protein
MAGRNATSFLRGVQPGSLRPDVRHAHWQSTSLSWGKALLWSGSTTDLCLFTDARYARHPSMADRHTAFQDSPMSVEHFPSGTVILPPPHLRPQ